MIDDAPARFARSRGGKSLGKGGKKGGALSRKNATYGSRFLSRDLRLTGLLLVFPVGQVTASQPQNVVGETETAKCGSYWKASRMR
jgi:hypothetical protein